MKLNQKGFTPILLILLAAAGLIIYLLVSSSAEFKNKLFSLLYPKPTPHAQEKPNVVPDDILLKFKSGVADSEKEKTRKQHGLNKVETIPKIEVERLKVPASNRDKVIEALKKNPNIEFAEPNYILKTDIQSPPAGANIPNDPDLLYQGSLTQIKAVNNADPTTSAWYYVADNSYNNATKIAILDSGIYGSHPDLQGKVIASINFTSDPIDDKRGHGTKVAGIAGALTNNATGITGAGFYSTLMNVKMANDSDGTTTSSTMASSITWATDNGAQVINISYGRDAGWLGWLASSTTEDNAVNYAWNHGVVVVASAGNDSTSSIHFPAFYDNAIAVAAVDSGDNIAGFSDHGYWVSVAAPGINVETTGLNNSYPSVSGTSFSAPYVSGLAALIWSKGNCSTNKCVRSQIETNADAISGTGTYWQWGRINAYRSIYRPPTIQSWSADITNPTTSVTSPPSGSSVYGTINIQASASDNVKVTKVRFYIDGKPYYTTLISPYQTSFDTTKVPNGSHTIQTKAWDAANNVGSSTIKTVTVNNTSLPTIVKDSFNRLNSQLLGNAETGQAWTAIRGRWGIYNNRAYPVDTCPAPGYAIVDSGVSDATIDVTIPVSPQDARIPFRYKDTDNLYWVERRGGSLAYYDLNKRVLGVQSNLGSLSGVIPADGDKIRIELSGSSIKIYVNGISRRSVTDSSLISTKHGIGDWCTASVRFDDYYVKSSSTPPIPTPTPTPTPTPKPSSTPTPTPTPSPGTLSWSVSATPVCPYQNIKVTWSYTGTLYKSFKPYLLDSLASSVAGPCSTSLSSSYTWTNKTIGGGHTYSITLQTFTDTTCATIYSAPNKSVTQASCSTCATSCSACTSTTTCGATTYDTCVDNLGRLKNSSLFCTSGATGFRCYASGNNNCISGTSTSNFNYSCSACSVPTPAPTPIYYTPYYTPG